MTQARKKEIKVVFNLKILFFHLVSPLHKENISWDVFTKRLKIAEIFLFLILVKLIYHCGRPAQTPQSLGLKLALRPKYTSGRVHTV